MMNALLAATAAAPLLIACASAGAQTSRAAEASEVEETRVLIVNGERIVIDETRDAASAIDEALANADGSHRIVLELDDASWSARDAEAFASAMAGLAEAFGEDFEGHLDFDFDFDFDAGDHGGSVLMMDGDGGETLQIMIERIERDAERHAERAEHHIERMEERAEHMAERMALRFERHAARAEAHGLRAGLRGVERGLDGIERTLERGWYEDDGERIELTPEKRADLEEARSELLDTMEALRTDLAQAQARHGAEQREVRIVRRDGHTRAFVDGEAVSDSELDRLLEGAPDAPEPPEPPQEDR